LRPCYRRRLLFVVKAFGCRCGQERQPQTDPPPALPGGVVTVVAEQRTGIVHGGARSLPASMSGLWKDPTLPAESNAPDPTGRGNRSVASFDDLTAEPRHAHLKRQWNVAEARKRGSAEVYCTQYVRT